MHTRLLIAIVSSLLAAACAVCPNNQIHCNGICVDLQTDENHCGSCANTCPDGATCSAGSCQCPTGLESCGGSCANVSTDSANCGACGHDCGLGTCSNGVCACNSTPATVKDCGGSPECVDTAADTKNCGGCSMLCPLLNEQCSGSVCGCNAPDATACPVAAPTACVDLTNDLANCGACGNECELGATCINSSCVCATGSTACPTVHPTACANLQTDPNNCSACGMICPTGETCQSGICCTGSICSGVCIDTTSSATDCGTCGNVCASATPNCISGACCGTGTTSVCGGSCCGGGATCCSTTSSTGTINSCQVQHFNGLGGPQGSTFFDCNAADSMLAAADAAKAWSPAGVAPSTAASLQSLDCFGWQTSDGTQCAVFCYTGSAAPGLVQLTLNSGGCVVPIIGGPGANGWE